MPRTDHAPRHRAPRTGGLAGLPGLAGLGAVAAPRRALGLAAAAAVAAVPAVAAGATDAQAATGSTWDRLAQCESSGRWDISTGNGFSGGLQFTPSTWVGFGGGAYSPSPTGATREQQIAVAEKVLAVQGWGAWPSCSLRLGLGSAAAAGTAAAPAVRTAAVSRSAVRTAATLAPAAPVAPAPPAPPSGEQYTVRAGDTLGAIAASRSTTWQALWSANRSVVADPNLIYPGEVLSA